MKKKTRKRIIWATVLFILLYFFLPIPFMKEHDLAVQESAFRYLYDAEEYGRKAYIKVLYLQLGEGNPFGYFFFWNGSKPILAAVDPPDRLMKRLSAMPVHVKPASEFDPTAWEKLTPEEQRNQKGVLFGVGPVIKSFGLARCRTYYDGGLLCSQENESFFVWTPFGWKHLFSIRLYIS